MENSTLAVSVKIFGVGTAGVNILEQIAKAALPGVTLAAINTDAKSLAASCATEKIALETKPTRGAGPSGDPKRSRTVAEENLPKLKQACEGVDVVFILAGLGGGAGTGISPVLAQAARESGALVMAFVAMPFDCEGNRRLKQAQQGLEQLKNAADGVICLPNQEIFKLIDEKTSVVETFNILNGLLAEGVNGVWRLMARKGLLEIHYADLCTLLRERRGDSSFATAEAAGATRSREVMDKLLAHPMLDGGKTLAESDAVLVSLTGGPDLTMAEVHRVMEHINGKCERAQVVMGAAIDEAFRERLAITLIAVRRSVVHIEKPEVPEEEQTPAESRAASSDNLTNHLLNQETAARPQSRFVAPAPELPQAKMEQLAARQTRSRKNSSKMRQGQLPLEIISKGRFDKSEPTIHKGEDLDVPTYIRRGVALN
jgi:cell division protein FtsZ